MNREIKFRGKNKDIGWVEGQVAYDLNEDTYIIREVEQDSSYGLEETMLFAIMWHRVDKETIGQYIGLCDKNGKEIYEGDILKSIQWNDIYLVKHIGTAYYLCRKGKNRFNKITTWNNAEKSEVIGNIYDNPELLGGENGI